MSEPQDRQPERAESPDYLRVIRARAWVIVLAVVVVLGVTLILAYRSTPQYSASSQLVFQPNSLDKALFGAQVYPDSNQPRDVETAAKLVKVEQVAEGVRQQLNVPYSTAQLLATIDVTTSSADNLLQINAVSSDPVLASQVANAFAQQFVIFRQNTDMATVAAARDLVKQQLDKLSPAEAAGSYGQTLRDKYASLQLPGGHAERGLQGGAGGGPGLGPVLTQAYPRRDPGAGGGAHPGAVSGVPAGARG